MTPARLACALAGLLATGAAAALRAAPVPYGHTSQVHPTNANHDREWYVEARWKKGSAYKPQDGPITANPIHAPPPPAPAAPIHPVRSNATRMINDRPKRSKVKKAAVDAKKVNVTAEAEQVQKEMDAEAKSEAAAKAEVQAKMDAAMKADNATLNNASVAQAEQVAANNTIVNIKSIRKDLRRKTFKEEPRYAQPKPPGHTSQVHPTNGNRDRRWYVEARWKPGQEYKAQDGEITEKPKHARVASKKFI